MLIRYKREEKVGGGTRGREINAIVPLDAADLYDATRRDATQRLFRQLVADSSPESPGASRPSFPGADDNDRASKGEDAKRLNAGNRRQSGYYARGKCR